MLARARAARRRATLRARSSAPADRPIDMDVPRLAGGPAEEPAPGRLAALGAALVALVGGSCGTLGIGSSEPDSVTRGTLVIQGENGAELGVNTDYGILFLGHFARAGEIRITAWFGDGPSVENTVVEPVGPSIYTAETDIVLPSTVLTFAQPRAGETVYVTGRRRGEAWTTEARVVGDDRVDGILLAPVGELRNATDQVGAGVYLPYGRDGYRLLGLVSGRLRLIADGVEREYLTVVGPEDIWRLVAHRRNVVRKRRWVYREDIL